MQITMYDNVASHAYNASNRYVWYDVKFDINSVEVIIPSWLMWYGDGMTAGLQATQHR